MIFFFQYPLQQLFQPCHNSNHQYWWKKSLKNRLICHAKTACAICKCPLFLKCQYLPISSMKLLAYLPHPIGQSVIIKKKKGKIYLWNKISLSFQNNPLELLAGEKLTQLLIFNLVFDFKFLIKWAVINPVFFHCVVKSEFPSKFPLQTHFVWTRVQKERWLNLQNDWILWGW